MPARAPVLEAGASACSATLPLRAVQRNRPPGHDTRTSFGPGPAGHGGPGRARSSWVAAVRGCPIDGTSRNAGAERAVMLVVRRRGLEPRTR